MRMIHKRSANVEMVTSGVVVVAVIEDDYEVKNDL